MTWFYLRGEACAGGAEDSLDDDETRYREPYVRGAVIALWLNAEIVRQTGGRASLDDVMRSLLDDDAALLTDERITQAAGQFVDAGTLSRLRRLVDDGAEISFEAPLLPCTRMVPRQVWVFALGLPMVELSSGTVLHDVDGASAAYRAGLRDGQTLIAWSMWHGDPDQEVTLTVRAAAPNPVLLRIRYLPRGRQVSISQIELLPHCQAEGSRPAAGAP